MPPTTMVPDRRHWIINVALLSACGVPSSKSAAIHDTSPALQDTMQASPGVLETFVRTLLARKDLQSCLGTSYHNNQHTFQLGFHRSLIEGRAYEILSVEHLHRDIDMENCVNGIIAHASQPAVTTETLTFMLVDKSDSQSLDYRNVTLAPPLPSAAPITLTQIAGTLGGPGYKDGPSSVARFHIPLGLAVSPSSQLYVADAENRAIREIDANTGEVATLMEIPQQATVQIANQPEQVERQNLLQPASLAFDHRGRLHALDSLKGAVWRLDSKTPELMFEHAVGAWNTPRALNAPSSMVFDGDGTVLIADSANHRIVRLELETGLIKTVAGVYQKPGHRNGGNALFNTPEALALGANGTLYVAEYGSNTIRSLNLATGIVALLAGSKGKGGHADGCGNRARFDTPSSLVLHKGQLYVAESHGLVIRQVDLESGCVSTIAGKYMTPGAEDGKGAAARFRHLDSAAYGEMPFGMAMLNGALYLADSGNHVVRRIDVATGMVSTIAGSSSPIANSAPSPRAIAFSNGNLYATAGQALWRISSNRLSLLAGHPNEMGHGDGIGGLARFRGPSALASLTNGNLVVGEVNGQVRIVDPRKESVTTLGNLRHILQAIAVDDNDQIYAAGYFEIYRMSSDGDTSVIVSNDANKHPDSIIIPSLHRVRAMAWDGPLLYILDEHIGAVRSDSRITTLRRVNISTREVRALAHWGSTKGHHPDLGGLAIDNEKNLILSYRSGAITHFDPITSLETTILVSATSSQGVSLGPKGGVNRPSNPIIGPNGQLFFIDEAAVLSAPIN